MTSTSTAAIAGGPLRPAVVLGGNRIPFARAHGAYAGASNQDMLTSALEGLVARFGLQGEALGEVVAGAVMKHSVDFNLTRESVLGTSLDGHTPAHDVQTACATGIETVGGVANKIRLGQIESGIGGGVDTISDAPLAFNAEARELFMQLNRARTTQDKIKIALKLRPKHFAPLAPQAGEVRTGLSMGEHQALTTHEWGVTREEQDELAMHSHNNMAAAYEDGFFNDLMTPFRGLDRDNNMRPGSTLESLAKLRIAFGKQFGEEATMTAGNSTPMTDGAAAALLSSEEWAVGHNLPILAEFLDFEVAAVDFVNGKEGLLMAPTYGIPRILDRHGLSLDDIDFFEIHEAFAGTVLSTIKALADEDYNKNVLGRDSALGQIDQSKLNLKGSSLAAGHPFAATGPRIVASLAKMLHEKGEGSLGLISVCAAGGQGAVALMRGR
ncbi:acetyl-CoA C-acetyltransferase [Enteractinococcus helveticum]|uniref:Acetyl-CoA acetyltransferase n=1 Tax=Enteractinococcus helveticum TaxID=1837282 RepID=A0A1B7LX87_9MICC|nr:acetyl-CoA C-acetyltransferase [Enteractinococcus helveticum]OAV59774.1 acetyl-CoA acetyltransferase [Enteractinococcus helveticum]